jgi:phenylacetate-CoA ligase
MLRNPPSHLYGYASAMVAFARILAEQGEEVRRAGVPTLVCTGETLYPFQREFLEEAYQARVVNEYGCTESGVLAFPCPEEDRLHISADNVLLEFLVDDRPARAGETAQVVLTDLYSADAPLIRYRLGDVVVTDSGGPCPCGRGLPTIERIEGRTSQMIQLPDGRQVHSEVFSYISDTFAQIDSGIESFRVRQTRDDAFVLQLVAPHSLEGPTLETLSALARRVLGESVSVDVEQIDELPRDPRGKLRYFVRDDPQPSPPEGSA